MKTRTVVLAPEAEDDLSALYDYIAENASPGTAFDFVTRIEAFCRSLTRAAERGAHHAAVREGLRSVGFEGRVTIVFHVDQSTVSILRVFPAGRNWTEEIAPESGDE